MGQALHRGIKLVASCTMVVARSRLLGCRAFMVVHTKKTLGLIMAKNMMNSRSALVNGASPSTTSPLLSAPREAARLASRVFVQNRAAHSSSGGGAAGESSSPPPEWNLPVSLNEYLALGPRQQQQQQPTEDWLAEAADLAASLGIEPHTSVEAQHRRVFHLYLPVFFWLKELLDQDVSRRQQQQRGSISSSPLLFPSPSSSPRDLAGAPPSELGPPPRVESGGASGSNTRAAGGGRTHSPPLVVGISAPQGCGKSTLVSEMKRMLEKAGYSCVVVSIDDFYLTGAEQDALAARYPSNPLLQVRGNAGTHDLPLALRTIRRLTNLSKKSGKVLDPSAPTPEAAAAEGAAVAAGEDKKQEGSEAVVCVPRYDKSARGGKGDRAPEAEWSVVSKPPDVVLLEGWMLGFEALPEESPLLAAAEQVEDGKVGGLGVVNTFLKGYKELHDEVDAWLVLKTADPEMVFEWRAEAERRMREAGRPGMSEEQVRDFCSRYMPAYRAYLPGLYGSCSCRAAGPGAVQEPGAAVGGDVANKGAIEGNEFAGLEKTLLIEVGRDRNPVL